MLDCPGRFRSLASLLLGGAVFAAVASPATGQVTTRITQLPDGTEATTDCLDPAISGDGRVIGFVTDSSHFDPSDTNGFKDVYVYDRVTGVYELVSRTKDGKLGNNESRDPALSTDGRYVLFTSFAGNLVSGDTNNLADHFVRDRVAGTTKRVNLRDNGAQITSFCYYPWISGNGQFVAFATDAANVVGGDTNGSRDVFVRDLVAKTTVRVSLDAAGAELPLGGDWPSLSDDGRYVGMDVRDNIDPADINGDWDCYVRDMTTGAMTWASRDPTGGSPNDGCGAGYLSGDGSTVAFVSLATDLVPGIGDGVHRQIFVRDLATGAIQCSSTRPGLTPTWTSHAELSADGRWVTFSSESSELVPDDTNDRTDRFVYDFQRDLFRRISVGTDGLEPDFESGGSVHGRAVSDDGLVHVFMTESALLDDDDTNGKFDVYVHVIGPEVATWSGFGSGLAGTLGVPTLVPRADPVLGTTLTVDLSNSAGKDTLALLAFGLASDDLPFLAGRLLVASPEWITLPLPAAGLAIDVDIPYENALCGIALFAQALEADKGAPQKISFTAGLELDLGF